MILITIAPQGQPSTILTINDSAQASLEAYRESLNPQPANIVALLLSVLGPTLLFPAFSANPPEDVKELQQEAIAKTQAAQQAMQAFAQSAITWSQSVSLTIPSASLFISTNAPSIEIRSA